ncbi:MAG: preprotein translocase subunit SecY, partial [Polyangiaceae bacterium]
MALFSGFQNIGKVPELRNRVAYTLFMMAVYRIGVFVTIPGVDRNVMQAVVSKQSGGLLGMMNMFSGGALGNLSIFALGIMPYVSASIVLQLLAMVYKPLEELRKEGEQGTRKINQYTRYGTILLSLMQSFGITMSL